MVTRTIDLSGTYVIASVSSTEITFASPEQVNPNWYYANLDGAGTTGYAQNVSMITPPVYQDLDFSGSGYTIASVTETNITLNSPSTINDDWSAVGGFVGGATSLLSANISSTNNANWIGPFIVENPSTTLLIANFLAPGGLYKDNGKKQVAFPVTMQLEATPVDQNDDPIGASQTFTTTVQGNSSGREQRAQTLVCELAYPGRQSVRARRVTPADLNYKGTVVDEVKWQDLYGIAPVLVSDFGNVTTVHSRTYATEGALSVKERKLNLLATRKVPIRTGGTSFSAPAATKNAADIFTAICLDQHIGRRVIDELDLDSIYGAVAGAVSYFGLPEAGQFSYTFDDDSISFEETAATVAAAVFSTAYRQGSVIRLALEQATENSALIFNHRNKVPETEVRTVRFGNLDDNDGVEVEYTDPDDDSAQTIYLPHNRSAVNPRKITAAGVRARVQAYWFAWRAWNKIQFQNVAVEFTALQEAATVARNDRVLIADNTRPETQDGELVSQVALEVQTSQPVTFAAGGYTIFIQLPDGTVDAMPVTPGSSDHKVVLGRAPRIALSFDSENYALPTYQIVRNDSPRPDAFLITQRQPDAQLTYSIQAVNYSFIYYANDQLAVWLDFQSGYQDAGPLQRDGFLGAGSGTGVIVADTTRGNVFAGTGRLINLPAFDAPASYTKAFWAKGTFGSMFGSTGVAERVHIEANGLYAQHSGGEVDVSWPGADGLWHHVAVTYDADATHMAVYIDGTLAGAGTVPQRAIGPLYATGYTDPNAYGFQGSLDDLRLMTRALAPAEVRALFQATRV